MLKKLFKYSFVISVTFMPNVSYSWLCTEAASERSGSIIYACGVATAKTEAEAQKRARDNALEELRTICNNSVDCKNKELYISPLRKDCTKSTDGTYKCYRGIEAQITNELKKDDIQNIEELDKKIEKLERDLEVKKERLEKQRRLKDLKERIKEDDAKLNTEITNIDKEIAIAKERIRKIKIKETKEEELRKLKGSIKEHNKFVFISAGGATGKPDSSSGSMGGGAIKFGFGNIFNSVFSLRYSFSFEKMQSDRKTAPKLNTDDSDETYFEWESQLYSFNLDLPIYFTKYFFIIPGAGLSYSITEHNIPKTNPTINEKLDTDRTINTQVYGRIGIGFGVRVKEDRGLVYIEGGRRQYGGSDGSGIADISLGYLFEF